MALKEKKNSCVSCGKDISRCATRCRSCRSIQFWSDPVQRARQSEMLRGRSLSPEHIAATARGLRGKPKSPEHRMKLAEAQRRVGEEQRAQAWAESFHRGEADECWEWQGTRFKGPCDYGRIGQGRAHVEMWERENGPVPEGLGVLHHCDNPPCVNPAHLYVGTALDNARDRKLRDRGVKGQRVNTSKLNEDQVYEIRAARDAGEKQKKIADLYGITEAMVSLIARRKSWAWLPERKRELHA